MRPKRFFQIGFLTLLFFSCQQEEEIIIGANNDPAPNALVVSSPLTKLISRVTQVPTSADNVLDGTSCFAVQLPITIVINSQTISVASFNDYQTVQNNKDASTTDDDVVNFVYPIILLSKNGTRKNINNSAELDSARANCQNEENLTEISCASFVYPILVNVYDTNDQLANTFTLQNNLQFFGFISNLTLTTISEIDYPIIGVNASGTNVIITDNDALENFIENAIPDCAGNNSVGTSSFADIVTSGTWRVSYYYEDDDETDEYVESNFTFNVNNMVTVLKNGQISGGTWSNFTAGSSSILRLTLTEDDLSELEKDWRIMEFTTSFIRLKEQGTSDDDDISYLNFTKN